MPAEALRDRLSPLPESPAAATALERLRDAAARQEAHPALAALLGDADVSAFLGVAFGDCTYLGELAAKDIARLAAVLGADPEARVNALAQALESERFATKADAMTALRLAKQDVALTVGLGDLAGALHLEQATALMTRFADAAVRTALKFALGDAARAGRWTGGDEAPGFIVLGMGKYGAGELNYSSDIDIIVLFDPRAVGVAEGIEPSSFWVRIVKLIVSLLQERTGDGYVFRTDLRLRPDPGATRVAISAEAALLYYESTGQNWERAALVKARPVAGDVAAGKAFLGELSPFIWRKYLDFAAIADIHSIKRQVHAHRGHAHVRVRGHDLKRGRGGIREIEFFVQTQQLIAGGREKALRGRRTRDMLRELCARGWIDETARGELDAAYVLLRNVEHRLQMVRDEQTHTMPADADGVARIGRLMGEADGAAFEARLRATLDCVARRYSELFETARDLSAEIGNLVFTGGDDDPETLQTLKRLNFSAPATVIAIVRGWHFGRFQAMRSATARERLTEITPALLEAFSRAGNPDAALSAFDDLLKALPAGAQLFALLAGNRELLDLLARILSAAPQLAGVFARRPHVADALIDPLAGTAAVSVATLSTALAQSLAEARRYEEALDRTRLFVAEQRFFASVGLLNGSLTPTEAGKAFSALAEAVVAALFQHTEAMLAERHGRVPGGRAVVVGFGRLGSREMTAGSDLDLIVIYDNPSDMPSDGPRPLPPSQYYMRLTQRLVAALSAPTAEGTAYEVDLRLRPSGRSGPLATRLESFVLYQTNEAWTWEHMAMSRGRVIAGDMSLGAEVETALAAIAAKPRTRAALALDVASMRARIGQEKAASDSLDVKLAVGGLIDCEFAAQFAILAGLPRMAGEATLEILERAARDGHLSPEAGERLAASCALQGALLQIERVAAPRGFVLAEAPDALKELLVAIADRTLRETGIGIERQGVADFAALTARLQAVQTQTRAALVSVLETPVA